MIRIWSYSLSLLFFPISFLWELLYSIRRFCYNYDIISSANYKVPIISVGNLTFGGTGKTPLTLWISRYISSLEKKSMILLRGYKGELEFKSGKIKAGKKLGYNPIDYGDEALIYARRLNDVSIVIGKKRSANLDYYFEDEKPDVVILDDGHQHLKIRRTLNIVLFDALMPLSRYKVAPRGYMREGFNALKDAQVIVIGRVDLVSEQRKEDLYKLIKKNAAANTPIVEFRYQALGLLNRHNKRVLSVSELEGKKAICIAGIASPESFYRTIEKHGCQVLKKVSFPDHHYFKLSDLEPIIEEAKKEEALIITTEKDMVKIKRVIDNDNLYYLEIDVEFTEGEELFKKVIEENI